MIVFIVGNQDEKTDSLPCRIMEKLKKELPAIEFIAKDPNEEWDIGEELIIVDTVLGIKDVTVFEDINEFQPTSRITMHGFDLLMNLKLLQKIGKLKKIKIIGIPPTILSKQAILRIKSILSPN